MHESLLDAFHLEHTIDGKDYFGVRSMFIMGSNGGPVSCSLMNSDSPSRVTLDTSCGDIEEKLPSAEYLGNWSLWSRCKCVCRYHAQWQNSSSHIFRRYSDITVVLHQILLDLVRFFGGAVYPDLLFMDDSDRPHKTTECSDPLAGEDIKCITWPAYSLDFNPIQHPWDTLDTRIAQRQNPPRTIQELKLSLRDERDRTPPRSPQLFSGKHAEQIQKYISATADHPAFWRSYICPYFEKDEHFS